MVSTNEVIVELEEVLPCIGLEANDSCAPSRHLCWSVCVSCKIVSLDLRRNRNQTFI